MRHSSYFKWNVYEANSEPISKAAQKPNSFSAQSGARYHSLIEFSKQTSNEIASKNGEREKRARDRAAHNNSSSYKGRWEMLILLLPFRFRTAYVAFCLSIALHSEKLYLLSCVATMPRYCWSLAFFLCCFFYTRYGNARKRREWTNN